jgi:hypothetical protein
MYKAHSVLSRIDSFDARQNSITQTLSITSRRSIHHTVSVFKPSRRREEFKYRPLPNEWSIRLLEVIYPKSRDEIYCSLVVKDVRSKPWYNCLSYTWGDPFPAKASPRKVDWGARDYSIICNNKTLKVTKNLRDAIWGLATSGRSGRRLHQIWIDAVCIDQDNIPERSAQVLQMHNIYRLAQSVIIWLGPETKSLDLAISVMHRVVSISPEDFSRAGMFHPDQDEPYMWMGIDKIYPYEWGACDDFFARTWFGRAWIFQEVVVARDLIVRCGSVEIPWNLVAHTSWFLNASQWDTRIGQGGDEKRNTIYSARYISRARQMMQSQKRLFSKGLTYDFLLERGRSQFQASDPRDMIYAVLGCCFLKFQAEVSVDYRKSVSDVYTEATQALILFSRDLRFLTAVEDASVRKVENLPSWVPDYSIPPYPIPLQGLHQDGKTVYSAAGGTHRESFRIRQVGKTVVVSGFRFDRIVDIGETHEELFACDTSMASLDRMLDPLDYRFITGETNIEAFWRTLVGNTESGVFPATLGLGKCFTSWVAWKMALIEKDKENTSNNTDIAVIGEVDGKGQLPTRKEILSCVASLKRMQQRSDAQATTYSRAMLFDNESSIVLSGRRLLRTEKRYLGLGPLSVKIGDEIFIIPGSNTPIILRKSSAESYCLVGEAYVHGTMQGEALSKNIGRSENIVIR